MTLLSVPIIQRESKLQVGSPQVAEMAEIGGAD